MDNRVGSTAPKASRPRRRTYSPVNRSAGLRRLPDDRLSRSFIGSLIVHAIIAILVFRVAEPFATGGVAIPSIAAWMDLTAPEPSSGGAGHPAVRAAGISRHRHSSASPSVSRSASAASLTLPPREETSALESLRPVAQEVLAVDSDHSVAAATVVPQLPKSEVALPIIDEPAQAPTASSLSATLHNPAAADAAPAETRADSVSESVAEPRMSPVILPVPSPEGEPVPVDGDLGRARAAASASPSRARITFDGPRAGVTQKGIANGIALSSPADGLIITPDDPPVVVVEGSVDDSSTTTLWLVANDRRIPVRVSDGRFRKILPLIEPTLRLWAEASSPGEPGGRSQIVTVHTTGARTPSAVLVMEWPPESQDLDVEVTALWRAHPDSLDEVAQPVSLKAVSKLSSTGPRDVFWLRNVRPGAYRMMLRYRGTAATGDVNPTLYVPEGDGLAVRAIRPVPLGSSGKAVLARVLFPQGVLWEQDAWFSGSSESAETVTKFRFPDGINWVERKADLQ